MTEQFRSRTMSVKVPPVSHSFRAIDVSLGGDRMTMQVGGSGLPLVLFHSLLADRTSFDRVAGPLAATHQVIVLNLPGFEGSDFVDGGLDAVADRVAAALVALQLRAQPILLGNGYGGFVALQMALRYPGLADRLVLADCGAAFSDAGRAAFRAMSATAAQGGLAAVADVAMRRLFAADYQALHPELIAQRKERFLALDPRTFHSACHALATLDFRPQLVSLRLPVLVLVGEMDEATPPPMSHELAAALANARLVVLSGCAHVPQLQAPDEFLAAIGGFLGIDSSG
jgi:3-oxoadipate enol-lactonase